MEELGSDRRQNIIIVFNFSSNYKFLKSSIEQNNFVILSLEIMSRMFLVN
jgi:hypothetical protein